MSETAHRWSAARAAGDRPQLVDKMVVCEDCCEQVAGTCKAAGVPCTLVEPIRGGCPRGFWGDVPAAEGLPIPDAPETVPDAEPREIGRVAIVTCFFNPAGYRNNLRNYFVFRRDLVDQAVDLFTIELSFDGRFDIPLEGNVRRIAGCPETEKLWQKERLLNLLIADLPDCYDAVGWFDADILFQNRDWLALAREKLGRRNWIQPFTGSWFTEADGSLTNLKKSSGWYYEHERRHVTNFGLAHPGFAWMARLDWVRSIGGLHDTNATGGGDTHTCRGFLPGPLYVDKFCSEGWLRAIDEWGARAMALGGESFGAIPGDIVHLYHGRRVDRRYLERWGYLADGQYDPATDIVTGPTGLLRWSDHALEHKSEMVSKVAGYFLERREDA